MMNPAALFYRRLKAEWAFQYRVWRMAVDWTVALYIVVPALAFGVYQIVSWWRTIPEWAGWIPFSGIALLLFAFAWSGTVRLYVEEADQLFLLQRSAWMSALVRCSVAYALLMHLLSTTLLFALLLPLLVRQYGLSAAQVGALLLLTAALKGAAALAKRLIAVRFAFWPRLALLAATAAASGLAYAAFAVRLLGEPALTAAAGAALCLVLVRLVRLRLRAKGTFHQDAAHAQEHKMRFAARLLGSIVPKRSRLLRRKRPWLFAGSAAIFRRRSPANVLAEACVKSFFRSPTQLKLYVQFTLVCASGALALPAAVKGWFGLATAGLLAYWLKLCWKEFRESSFVKLYAWSGAVLQEAAPKATFAMFVPGYSLIAAVLGAAMFGWWGVLLLPAAGAAAGWSLSRLLNGWG